MKVVTKIELQKYVYVCERQKGLHILVCLYCSMHLCVPQTGLHTHINTHSGGVNLRVDSTHVYNTHIQIRTTTHTGLVVSPGIQWVWDSIEKI